ncbi:MAG: DNA polymerase III subunit beta [Bacilli bacterium]|nr:DNA polymerase III subunit beta [Bacilli bacterium]
MRFIISRDVLESSLNIVSKAVTNKTPIAVLTGIKFDLTEEGLNLTGSDTDLSISTFIPVETNTSQNITVFSTGSCVLNAKYITEIVKKIDSDRIELELIDSTLVKITDQKSNFSLNSINVADFPFIDFNFDKNVIVMKGDLLKQVISQTIFATSIKETRPILTGVNFKIDGNVLEAVATDTYRLAKKKVVLGDSAYVNVTIPNKSLSEVSKIISGNEEVTINFFDKKVLFKVGDTIVSTRVINGVYPDTTRLIPENFDYKLTTLTTDIVSAVDRASLLSTDGNNIVKLSMNLDKIELSSRSQEIGSVVEKISNYDYKGNKLDISFSAQYIQDAIKAIGSNEVELSFTSEMKPFIIKNKEDNTVVQLVLPVRTYQ